MHFEPSEEQRLIETTARQFAEQVLKPAAAERDQKGLFPDKELRLLGELGLLGVNVPSQYGGSEAGAVAYSLAVSEVAAADASVSVAMAVTNMVAEVICAFGSEAQKTTYVPRLCSGEAIAGAFALSEPQAGSDAASLQTVAERVPGGYRLTGNKQWITSGDRAGVIVVWARTDGGKADKRSQAGGLSAFIVEGGAQGLVAGRPEHKLGLKGSTTVPLLLDGCFVPESARLGNEGDGFKIAMVALDGGRIGIASQAVGVGRAALSAAKNYAKERKQFGQAIADFQAIGNMLADAATQLDAARLLAVRAAYLKEQKLPFSQKAAMAKLYASEAAGRICDMALQVHGGYGYTQEFPVERYLRDARVQRIYEGTSEIQRLVIARSVLKEFSDHAS
ncbi:MAG TPA: acyl-CoA dehydrogenase family protein [Pseudomonadota bacterium]|nr:acyl-CoA dehydrogenase family protein [Pseudomonadota bacterium]HNK46244.1 acyl-CoA dehydrogenase family protein [Pseudomonadota bacterium]HNN53594.1 acyl-CoA dehydrogenase family protein [Pseudomonadota bacterium]